MKGSREHVFLNLFFKNHLKKITFKDKFQNFI